MDFLKQKNAIVILVIALVLLTAGGIYAMTMNKQTSDVPSSDQQQNAGVIPTISPESLGLSLELVDSAKGGQEVVLKLTQVAGISKIEYQLMYTSKGDIPRGVAGEAEVMPGDASITKNVYLGTCSDVCHPDLEVADVKVILKVTKLDGTVYQAQQKLES